MKTLLKIIIVPFILILNGCYYQEKNEEILVDLSNEKIIFKKVCIDGVIYLMSNNHMTVKVNKENKVEICEVENASKKEN